MLHWWPGEIAAMQAAPEKMTTAEWAAQYVVVPEGPRAGMSYDPFLTPYFVPLWDVLDRPHIRELILAASPQIGKTLFSQVFLARRGIERPGPRHIGMPDEDAARGWMEKKLGPFFSKSRKLRRRLARERFAVTSDEIKLENGTSYLVRWAGSASKRASLSALDLLLDEPDMCSRQALLDFRERTRSYRHTRKILEIGKPVGRREESLLWQDLQTRAQVVLRYEARCPLCQTYQEMRFENIRVPEGVRDPLAIRHLGQAWYECADCGSRWNDAHRDRAVQAGRWKADRKADRPTVVGAHLPAWYSPWVGLAEVMAEWFEAQGDPERLQGWWNGYAAQPFDEVITETDEDKLENFVVPDLAPLVVPDRAVAVTCAVDMQKHDFRYSIWAHALEGGGEPREEYEISYGVVQDWADLEELVFRSAFRREGTEERLSIWRAALDTGGGEGGGSDESRPVQAMDWLTSVPRGVVHGTKGMSRRTPGQFVKIGSPLEKLPNGRALKRALRLYLIDTIAFKDLLFWRFSEESTEPIWFHSGTGRDYLRELCSERKEIRKGKHVWKAVRANHWLDCAVMHLAMTHFQWTPALAAVASRADGKSKAEAHRAKRQQKKEAALW